MLSSQLAIAGEAWNLVGPDFKSTSVTLLGIDANGVRIASDDGSNERTVAWGDILELDHPSAAGAAGAGRFVLHLNGGDVIGGVPISIADDGVTWGQPLLGRLQIPEDRVNAIVRNGQSAADLDQPRRADSVRLLNGDATSGVINGMDDSGLSIQPAGSDSAAKITLDKIAAILLADPDPHAGSTGGWRVWLADGSSLTVPLAELPVEPGAKLQIGFSQKRISRVDLAAVTCIEQTAGPVRWLTSLTPSEVIYHPFLEENFPPQFDHPVDDPDTLIHVKYPAFRHGIGVHSYTRLTYAVPEGFDSFRTQYAVERITGADEMVADVPARILVDGKVVRDFPHVRSATPVAPVVVDVSGAKEISLEVDFGDAIGAQGRFLWLDPAFVKSGK